MAAEEGPHNPRFCSKSSTIEGSNLSDDEVPVAEVVTDSEEGGGGSDTDRGKGVDAFDECERHSFGPGWFVPVQIQGVKRASMKDMYPPIKPTKACIRL